MSNATLFQKKLQALCPDLTLSIVESTTSTNDDLRHQLTLGVARPQLLLAHHQTQGRGRMGRHWHASKGALTFSMALPLPSGNWAGLSLNVGLAVVNALDPLSTTSPNPRLGLKWPNDIWLMDSAMGAPVLQGRKLGGILIETCRVKTQPWVVIGVGLNIEPAQLEAPLSQGFACLKELAPQADAWHTLEHCRPFDSNHTCAHQCLGRAFRKA
jgi:biotin-[acetyl-CoA-carboxylase] ligase BirA-like protein